MKYKPAFLFDLNGTMIDDMQYHIKAWYRILNELGANISIERVKEECYGKNHELLERVFPGRFTTGEKNRMSLEKEKEYQQQFKPHLALLPGLHDFLRRVKEKKISMAIGSAAIKYNLDFVLDNLDIRHYFDALVCADDVSVSKPDAETYLKCATALNVRPENCIVFEDVPKGAESAFNAGMRTVVITLMHQAGDFKQYSNIEMFIKDFTDPALNRLFPTQ